MPDDLTKRGTPRKRAASAGGARPNSGPARRRIHLDPETARELRIITYNRRSARENPALTEAEVVAELIHQDWQAYDESVQEAAEMVERWGDWKVL